MSPLGLLVLAVLLVTAGVVMERRHAPQWAMWTLGVVVVVLPLVAYAGTITIPNTFITGTIAKAGKVNENFDELVVESNSQDGRIVSLEASVVHTHPGSDITSQVDDADTVDGVHASDLEESAEIDANIATHAADASAHHIRYADGEAQTAMGAKQDTNPLNHDRYTDAEAVSAVLAAQSVFALVGRVSDLGAVRLTSSPIGATFSVNHPSTGVYNVSVSGVPAGNYRIDVQLHADTGGGNGLFHQPKVTDKGATTGFGTNTGFSINTWHQVGAGAATRNVFWSFAMTALP
jgi:hypothetical protein